MFYDQDADDREYEFNARYDYMREAYGDPCPTHGILRGGGDCWKCEQIIDPEEPEENPREKGDDDGVEYADPRDARDDWPDDDIPF